MLHAGFSLVVMSRGHRLAAVCGLVTAVGSHCGAQALGTQTSVGGVRGLSAPWHVGSYQTRHQTGVLCTGTWILNNWATGGVLSCHVKS